MSSRECVCVCEFHLFKSLTKSYCLIYIGQSSQSTTKISSINPHDVVVMRWYISVLPILKWEN